jgi:hypothetical protein
MPDFDPYYEWLGIPPKDQPAHHYRLLGVELFEEHRSAIDAAANRLMAYLQELSNGEDAALAQKLLNEVSAARVCLLNPKQKSRYDRKLKAYLQKQSPQAAEGDLPVATPLKDKAVAAPPPIPTAQIIPDSDTTPLISTEPEQTRSSATTSRRSTRRSKNNETKVLFAIITLLLVAAGTLIYFYGNRPAKEASSENNKPSKNQESLKPLVFNLETVTGQAREFARSAAREAKKSNSDIVETCEIAAFLIEPYWQHLEKRKMAEQETFYRFVAQQALQLLTDGHSLTKHELRFRNLPANVTKRPRIAADGDRTEYDQYVKQVGQEGREAYRAQYTQEFDQQAKQQLGIEEE